MTSILIPEPSSQEPEEWLRFTATAPTGQGNHVVVVSGYANYDDNQIAGDEDEDTTWVNYTCKVMAGPVWRELNDVSPIATLTGIQHYSSDEADQTGYAVYACGWALHEPAPKRIELTISLGLSGGPDARITRIAYHLVARGYLMPGQDFNEDV